MRVVSTMVLVSACSAAAFAQHAGDVELTVENGVIRTNDGVYGADFGEFVPNFTDEPGFDNLPGTFALGTRIGFTIHGALRRWGNGAFLQVPSDQIEIGFAGAFSVTTPTTDTEVPGFSLPVGANGEWHRHLEYTLLDPAQDGVYLLALSLHSSSSAVGPSEVFYIVFNQNSDEATHADAIAWVRANLLPPECPADWDRSGGVDSDDVIAFFAAWDSGNADITGDGGTDSDDVIAFFAHWDNNC